MTSLRDIGYDLPSAVADLIDNCIDAGSTEVDITIGGRGAKAFLCVADNGKGMSEKVLDEAMRYGSRRSYDPCELGRFGLGLKTASLSQCKSLTVATRTTVRGPTRVRRWDLDRVRRHDRWELERLVPSECAPELIGPLIGRPGTVVLWEKLDRVLAYSRPDGERAARDLNVITETVSEHLAMVFHRFLAGETRDRRKISIWINDSPIEPWDPFSRSEVATDVLPEQSLPVSSGGVGGELRVKPYVLPSQVEFSSAEAHSMAAGPKKWNRQQGFYIYRGDRLIQSGGWNRLRTMDEHSKLARIALDIPDGFDDLFHVNVAKMRVVVRARVRPDLRALAAGVAHRAQVAYRRRLRLVPLENDSDPDRVMQIGTTSYTLGPVWPLIADVIHRELHGHPDLLERVLVALANTTLHNGVSCLEASTDVGMLEARTHP